MLCTFDDTDVVWMRGADEPLDFPLNLDVLKQLEWSSEWMVFLDLQDGVVVVRQVPVEGKDVHIEDEDIDEGLEAIPDDPAILDADEVE